jgi:hypothetical protein
MVSDPVGILKAYDVFPLEELLPIGRIYAKLLHRRAPNDANRRGLRRLVGEEFDFLKEGDRGGRGYNRRKRLRVVNHQLQIRHRGVG